MMSLLIAFKTLLGPRLYRIHETNNSSVRINFVVLSEGVDLSRKRKLLKNNNSSGRSAILLLALENC